jgi:hypothetical protein
MIFLVSNILYFSVTYAERPVAPGSTGIIAKRASTRVKVKWFDAEYRCLSVIINPLNTPAGVSSICGSYPPRLVFQMPDRELKQFHCTLQDLLANARMA